MGGDGTRSRVVRRVSALAESARSEQRSARDFQVVSLCKFTGIQVGAKGGEELLVEVVVLPF